MIFDTDGINAARKLRNLPPIEEVWHLWPPSCKLRVLGKQTTLKRFTCRFVINQINLEQGHGKRSKSKAAVQAVRPR